ncbi:MAG: hypothetical protein DCC49_07565 [Acidobacteria bacterium]|nr:MAG: hypothetical protein DCC49_07565 [Acidobacteriota bacterium]
MARPSSSRLDRLADWRDRARPHQATRPITASRTVHGGSRPRPLMNLALVVVLAASLAIVVLPRSTESVGREEQVQSTSTQAPVAPSGQNLLASLPARFEPNVGQAPDGVAYTLRAKGFIASLSSDAIRFGLPEGRAAGDADSPDGAGAPVSEQTRVAAVSMTFAGANPQPVIEAGEPQAGVSNYFLGSDQTKWRTDVGGYSKVYYRDLWPGIDMVIYDDHGQVRYDFEIAPGADPGQISLQFEGAQGIAISEEGRLQVDSDFGRLVHRAPFAYQGSERSEVFSRFVMRDERIVGFEVGAYDQGRPLVIDPTLTYSTYLGGGAADWASAVAVDSSGAAYVTGYTGSTDFPTASPFQGVYAGGVESFVTKFSASGSSLAYSSYLGGSSDDTAVSIAIDASGAAYVTGKTFSVDFPTASAFQGFMAGAYDVFVAKVHPSGSSLSYSSYLGGTDIETGRGIAVDSSGAAYVVGDTASATFPTVSPIQGAKAGGTDGFISKVGPAGLVLVYSTFLGGTGFDEARGVAVDSSGAAYVAGYTGSTDFPMVAPLQPSNAGGSDAFVFKANPAGSALDYSTYLGGAGADFALDLEIDSSGSATVVGSTASSDFPMVSASQPSYGGGATDAFATHFAASGASLDYSTYLGGSSADDGRSMELDADGNAIVAGKTSSSDFPTEDPYQADLSGTDDAFMAMLDGTDSALLYSTYLGGTGSEDAQGVAVDSSGNTYIAGPTSSADFPTVGEYQTDQATGDGFLTKHPPPVVTISGTFTGGMWGSISIYSKATGAVTAYQCCIAGSGGSWSIKVPPSNCAAGRGYAILYLPPDDSTQSRWYNDKPNFSGATCVRGPSSGNDMTIPSAAVISGYVKDSATAADIDGASVYAFKADGTYAGFSASGSAGPGRYELLLSSSETYKILVNPGAGYVTQWFSGAQNFTDATAQAPPATANFSVTPADAIDGYVKDASTAADLNGYPVYAYTSAGTFFAKGVTDRGYGPGRYRIQVNPGESYRLVTEGGPYTRQWFSGASSFSTATDNVAPFTANFSLS